MRAPLLCALLAAVLGMATLLPSALGQQTGGTGGGNFQLPVGPMAVFHTAQITLASRSYPSCAWNTHSIIQRQPASVFYQLGGQTVPCCNGFLSSMDVVTNPAFTYSYTNTFTPTNFTWSVVGFSGSNAIARVAPLAAVLANGALVIGGGKTAPNWAWGNDVIYSMNQGQSWSLATQTAPWAARSDGSDAVAPGTNVIVYAGGTNGPYLNDVWISSDGRGAVWTLQTSNPGFMGFQQAPMAFMYDGVAAGGSNALSTLILYNPSDNNVYQSTNYGSTWSLVASLYVSGANPQQTGRMVADLEGYLYMAGGAEVGGQVYFSTNKGALWALMNQTTFYPGLRIADPMVVNSFEYGCLAINYVQATGAPNGYHKQLIQYGGALTATQVINSNFGCTQQSGSASYSSIVADLIFPGETVSTTSEWTPGGGSINNLTMVFHDAANQLIFRSYSDLTFDVHAAITRNSSVRMWQLGGFALNYAYYVPTIDYTATGNWNQFTTFTPTYNTQLNGVTYPQPGGKVAAGVGLLYNGALLLFGGKDANASAYTNDVFLSMDNGQTWTLQTNQAPWSQRSDMSVAVMPGLNVIVMGGGQGNPNSLNVGDFWSSQDGAGKVWTAGARSTPFGVFQDAAFVALYDNTKTGGTQALSTLLINPGIITAANADAIYSSVDAGATWQLVRQSAPWTQRIRGNFVADMENYVYMMGGQPGTAGDIWVSGDKGATWNFIPQRTTSNAWSNLFSLQSAQQNGMAIRYAPNAQSPNGYHKQFVLWGGPAEPLPNTLVSIQVSQRSAPSCVRTLPANVVYGELMFPQEQQADAQGQFLDTLNTAAAVSAASAPSIAFNNPSPLLTYRQYASCAADVHALSRGQTPTSFALGGWDVNNVPLTTVDVISGVNTNGYAFTTPQWGAGIQTPSGRVAGVSAYTAGGVLIWGGGKTGPSSLYSNDVWYSLNQGQQFAVATLTAAWSPRSDSAVAAIPGTNCVVVVGGQGLTVAVGNFQSGEVFFNDVWTSCDGIGASWQMQTGAAPFATAQQGSLVALYDNTGSSTQPTNTLVYYSWADQFVRSSNNMGATWKTLTEVSWSQRLSRFVADANNNIYMPGGMNPNGNNGYAANYDNGVGDVWYSSNKGATWSRLTQTTSAGYSNPVTLSAASYSCATLVPGTAPHNQLLVYSNWIEVFSATATIRSSNNPFAIPTAQCSCDSLSGIRAVVGDLIAQGETPNNLPVGQSNSGGGSKTFSQGATAGIAIGVGVGCMLLCCVLFAVFFAGSGRGMKGEKDVSGGAGRHKHMEEEVSTSAAPSAGVEMESRS